MPTKIEILSIGEQGRVTVAFYYPIAAADRLPGAVNPTRVAAGTRLSAAELAALRSGAAHELIKTIGFGHREPTPHVVAQRLETAWTELQETALADYRSLYSFGSVIAHASWDGVVWSRP